jgi:pimeloyl-ACP methyl ester carboxylesterase
LLHGILRSARSMRGIERLLQARGYRTLNLTYPSRQHDLRGLSDWLHPHVQSFMQAQSGPLHLIGHSMGGLLMRHYLHHYPRADIGRIVMLGTPNHGSEVADFLQGWRLYRWGWGPAGQQLCQHATHPELTGGEVGVIAGDRTLDPLSSAIIGRANDGKVAIESTRLATPHSHTVLHATHSFMPLNKQVQRAAVQFIERGKF